MNILLCWNVLSIPKIRLQTLNPTWTWKVHRFIFSPTEYLFSLFSCWTTNNLSSIVWNHDSPTPHIWRTQDLEYHRLGWCLGTVPCYEHLFLCVTSWKLSVGKYMQRSCKVGWTLSPSTIVWIDYVADIQKSVAGCQLSQFDFFSNWKKLLM